MNYLEVLENYESIISQNVVNYPVLIPEEERMYLTPDFLHDNNIEITVPLWKIVDNKNKSIQYYISKKPKSLGRRIYYYKTSNKNQYRKIEYTLSYYDRFVARRFYYERLHTDILEDLKNDFEEFKKEITIYTQEQINDEIFKLVLYKNT